MTLDVPSNTPEKREALDDNARKFIAEPIPSEFFEGINVNSFMLTVDWLETDEDSETKLAHKIFDDGTVEILLITKMSTEAGRKTDKKPLSEEEYRELLAQSMLHLEKHRREFAYEQNGIAYQIKYDVFADEKLHMIEVDASSDEERANFSPLEFPVELREVTGNLDYYGYRVCRVL